VIQEMGIAPFTRRGARQANYLMDALPLWCCEISAVPLKSQTRRHLKSHKSLGGYNSLSNSSQGVNGLHGNNEHVKEGYFFVSVQAKTSNSRNIKEQLIVELAWLISDLSRRGCLNI
jgi:hypothetical protein